MRIRPESTMNVLENHIPQDGKGSQWLQITAVFAAASGTFSAGALIAWTSPSIPILTSNASHIDPITLEEASYFTIIPATAAACSAPILALLVDGIGRKRTLMVLATLYLLSWILIAFAKSLPLFYIARVLEGIGDATLFTVVPMYIGEVTQPNVRSTWGNLIAFFGFLGQFFTNVIGSYCDIVTTAVILSCVPLIQFAFVVFMPESPYFFLMKNRVQEARISMKMLRWKDDVDEEFTAFSKSVQHQMAESGTYKDLFFNPTHFRTLIIAVGLRAAQQLSGIPAFFMYTQYMFHQAGSDIPASTSAIIFSGVFVIVITTCSFFVGRFGRKPLMILSCFGCAVVLAIEAAYFFISEKTGIDISHLTWLPLAGMIVFVIVCSPGLGIIPTLMLGELFATSVKGKAMCIVNICFSIFTVIIVKLFQTMSDHLGMYAPFCLFSACCFANGAFSYFFVPETKGKMLEEIQQNMKGQDKERIIMLQQPKNKIAQLNFKFSDYK